VDLKAETVSLKVKEGSSVRMDEDIATVLGFKPSTVYKGGTYTAKSFITSLSKVYVYSNVVQSVPIGGIRAPLLRTIDAETSSTQSLHTEFHNVYFHPVSRQYFDTLSFDLSDEFGNTVLFSEGSTIVTLHFRPRQHM
jgi:hypothetical protein